MRGTRQGCLTRILSVVCGAMLFAALPPGTGGDSRTTDEAVSPAALPPKDTLASIPADFFLENAGQLNNEDVRFYTTSGDVQVGFADSAVLVKIVERPSESTARPPIDREPMRLDPPEPGPSRGVLLRLNFEGANEVIPQGRDPLPHPTNFFLGDDPSRWRTNVRSYREVVYSNLYDGIDLAYRIGPEGLKYDVMVRPGADPGRIVVAYEGIEGLEASADGRALVVRTALGDLSDAIPRSYQGDEGIPCAFELRTPLSHGLACRGWNPALPLVIDPLLYSTHLGGGDSDKGRSVAVDASGNAYVTGETRSTDYPSIPGAFDPSFNGGPQDAFLVKLNAAGSDLLYATYLGGGDRDEGHSVAVDASGNAYVTGETRSTDFPTTPGASNTTLSGGDVFVAKLDATGGSLLYSICLGVGQGYSVAVDASGNAYVTGLTDSTSFPTTPGALATSLEGDRDAFLAKLNAAGSDLLYATYLGGGDRDEGHSVAVDASGNAYVTGLTDSTNFPTTPGASDASLDGFYDAFVAKLNAAGSDLLYATYLGGSGLYDSGYSVAVDASGYAYVVGETWSADFPTTPDASDASLDGFGDAFVAKLNAAGSDLLYATYLGGSDWDGGYSVALDPSGRAYVTGNTGSNDFPTTPGAFDSSLNGFYDAFVAELDAAGSALLYATYLGGGLSDWGFSVAVDASGSAFVVGDTNSTDFPTTPGALDTSFNGGEDDVFVAKLDLNTPPTVTITSPVGGEEWLKGSVHTISWTMHDDEDADANLTVFINCTAGGATSFVAGGLKGQTSFVWTLQVPAADDVVVTVTVIDTGGLKGYSQSGPFTVKAPPVQGGLGPYGWLIGVLVVVAVFLLLLILLARRKRGKEGEAEKAGVPPPEIETTPPNG